LLACRIRANAGAARLLLSLKTIPSGKLYELEGVHIPSLYACSYHGHTYGYCSVD